MNTHRFDFLVRTLGMTQPRRAALRLLAIAVAAPALAANVADVGADHDRAGQRRPHRRPCGDICRRGCRYTNLQKAIDAAKPGDTIHLCAGTFRTDTTIYIGKDVILIGAGVGQTILDGNFADRVLYVSDHVTATIQDVTIQNGRADAGAGIENDGVLTLERVILSGNAAPSYLGQDGVGGAILNHGEMTLLDTSVKDNTADTRGGGVFNYGRLTLGRGSSVVGNTAHGISCVGNGDCPSQRCSAGLCEGTGRGGGIENNGATLILEAGSSVIGNTAAALGGGIYNAGGTASAADSAIVTGNTPNNCDGDSASQGSPPVANCVG